MAEVVGAPAGEPQEPQVVRAAPRGRALEEAPEPDPAQMLVLVAALPVARPADRRVLPIRTHLWRQAPGQAVRVGPVVPERARLILTQLDLLLDRPRRPAPQTIQ